MSDNNKGSENIGTFEAMATLKTSRVKERMDGFVVPLGNCLQPYQRQKAGERLHRRVELEKTFFFSSKNLVEAEQRTHNKSELFCIQSCPLTSTKKISSSQEKNYERRDCYFS